MYDIIFVLNEHPYSINAYKKFKQKYPLAKTARSYDEARKKSFTNAFWVIWPHLQINNDFLFEHDVPEWDEEYVHVFSNGICLIPKKAKVSEREFTNRFFINKKEIETDVNLNFKYDKFVIESYEEYLDALNNTSTELFWIIPNDVEPLDDFKFDLYFSSTDTIYDFDRKMNHVFQNNDNGEIKYNGIMLVSTHSSVSKKEIEYRYIVEKKEYNIVASKTKSYDVVFISYDEPNADKNYQRLLSKYPCAKRIHKVTGIHQAHIEAAKLCTTPMFWVIDGDAQLMDNFNLDYSVPYYDRDCVHVWRSINPVNNLEYGYGGVKLLPRKKTLGMDVNTPDMTTAISDKFKVMEGISNITAFNTDPFNTWKSAFRECVKLSSKTIQGQLDEETEDRLNIWCNFVQGDFAIYAMRGARSGRRYGEENAGNIPALSKINDFDWLEEQFKLTSVLRSQDADYSSLI